MRKEEYLTFVGPGVRVRGCSGPSMLDEIDR